MDRDLGQDRDGNTPLHLAVSHGHVDVIRLLIERGADINARNDNRNTPLHLAASHGHVNVVEFLIRQGVDVNTRDKYGNTLLHLAASHGHVNVVEFLIREGVDVHAQNRDGNTPLHLAVSHGHVNVIRLLIERGADINARNRDGDTPIRLAFNSQDIDWSMVRLLIEAGAGVNIRNVYHELYLAASNGNVNIVEFLTRQGVDVNTRDRDGNTLLHLAASNGNVNVMRLLIEQGADIHDRNRDGDTPLRLALDSQNIDWSTVRHLIEAGADGNTPLRLALDSQNIDWSTVRHLIEAGADINTVNRSGETVLRLILNFQCSDSTGHEALLSQLSILLDYAANQKNEELKEIFDRIRLLGKLLHEQGINITAPFSLGMTKASKSGNDKGARKMTTIVSEITYPFGSVNDAQVTNDQTNQQQESDAQASCAQPSQQQEPNAQATNDSNVPSMSRSRSSNLSSSGGSNNDQPGPSSELSETPPISRSQSLDSLHSNDSDVKIISGL